MAFDPSDPLEISRVRPLPTTDDQTVPYASSELFADDEPALLRRRGRWGGLKQKVERLKDDAVL